MGGDIEAGIWAHVDGRIEVRFGTVPTAIEQDGDGATVSLRGPDGRIRTERVDLVVGADGMRSTVRKLVFGPHEDHLVPMGTMICAFQMSDQLPGHAREESLVVSDPNRALWVFALDGTAPTALFTYRTTDTDAQFGRPRAEALAEAYAGMGGGGAVEAALDEFRRAPEHLFDSVHQVRMPRWHSGRVVLVGDAAWCLTLYSGMGATAGMLGGSELGDALERHPGDLEGGLADFERSMRPFVRKHQRTAWLKSQFFVPQGRAGYVIRRRLLRSLARKAVRAEARAAA